MLQNKNIFFARFASLQIHDDGSVPSNSENKPWGLYFSKALFEGLIFGGACVRREICVSKSVGLALFLEGNLPFFFVLLCS